MQGQPSRLRNLRTSRWPWAAASTHASESHSTLSDSLNHWRGRGERVRVFRFGGGISVFVFGLTFNTISLYKLVSDRVKIKVRSKMNLLLIHLAIADLVVSANIM